MTCCSEGNRDTSVADHCWGSRMWPHPYLAALADIQERSSSRLSSDTLPMQGGFVGRFWGLCLSFIAWIWGWVFWWVFFYFFFFFAVLHEILFQSVVPLGNQELSFLCRFQLLLLSFPNMGSKDFLFYLCVHTEARVCVHRF